MLVCFMTIWNIYTQWVQIMAVWYNLRSFGFFSRFGKFGARKNLATPVELQLGGYEEK
jgi:hypothetical protein